VHLEYAKQIEDELRQAGLRVEIDERDEKMGYKIREAQMQKIPYMLVVGDKERDEKAVNVRKYGEQKSETVSFESFLSALKNEVEQKGK
jgi:threonyl-tRNA synthetase